MKYQAPTTGHIYHSIEEVMSDYNNITSKGRDPEAWNSDWEGRTDISQDDVIKNLIEVA